MRVLCFMPPGARLGALLALSFALHVVPRAPAEELSGELAAVAHKIVFETYRQNNWELCLIDAGGSNPMNLTRTPNVDELYPHASPDGKKICFVVDSGAGPSKTRSVYYMSADGTGRTLVARRARQPCWTPGGTSIAYLKAESDRFSAKDYATRGIFVYDLADGAQRQHPNKNIHHLYNIGYSPDGQWILATVHAGMGFRHAILAIEARGGKVFNLELPGCRPEFSPDGKMVLWGAGDYTARIAELDLTGPQGEVAGGRDVVHSEKPMMTYHFDWSPDGRYIAFTRGRPSKTLGSQAAVVGSRANGWDLCVADATKANRWVTITHDGLSNKEPDWVFVEKREP